jgi:hypothetical protein
MADNEKKHEREAFHANNVSLSKKHRQQQLQMLRRMKMAAAFAAAWHDCCCAVVKHPRLSSLRQHPFLNCNRFQQKSCLLQ